MRAGITGLILREAYPRIKDSNVVLYPMGDNGIVIKNFLNSIMKIQEYAIIDKQLSKVVPGIFSVDEIKLIPNYKDCVFLITSNKDCFSRYLIEQGISQTNIINPWISRDELIMNCFIHIINNENYQRILDYQPFLYNYGQFTKNFYSSLEDKYYFFDDKQFFTIFSINELLGFKNLYSPYSLADVCVIVIEKCMDKRQIESVITEQLMQKIPLFCIAEDSLEFSFRNPDKAYRFSRLYVYQWETKV